MLPFYAARFLRQSRYTFQRIPARTLEMSNSRKRSWCCRFNDVSVDARDEDVIRLAAVGKRAKKRPRYGIINAIKIV